MTVAELQAESAALLNDANQTSYTNVILFPYYKIAKRKLLDELRLIESPYTAEISAALSVGAGVSVLTYTSTPALPADFMEPVKIQEIPSGSTTYEDMIRLETDPEADAAAVNFSYWCWREGEIKLLALSAAKSIKIFYKKSSIETATTSTVDIPQAASYLIAKTAALAARYIGENNDRSTQLEENEVKQALATLLVEMAKSKQAFTYRRKPFRAFRG